MLHRFVQTALQRKNKPESEISKDIEKFKKLILQFNAKPIELVAETPRTTSKIQDSVLESAKKNYDSAVAILNLTEEQKLQLQNKFGIHIEPTPRLRPSSLNYSQGNVFDCLNICLFDSLCMSVIM